MQAFVVTPISPQSLSVACAATGMVGRESEIFRFTLKHSIILTTVIALIVYGQSTVLSFLVPTYAKGPAVKAAAAAPDIALGINYLAGTVAIAVLVATLAFAWTRSLRFNRPAT